MSPDFDYTAVFRKLLCFPILCKLKKSYRVYRQVNKAFPVNKDMVYRIAQNPWGN